MKRRRVSLKMLGATVTSLALHGAWLASDAEASYGVESPQREALLEAELVPPPAAQPAPPAPEVKPAQDAPAVTPAPHPENRESKPAPATPTAAQAATTLTAPDTAPGDSVADFTMVQGSGTAYAGGTTTSLGTSTQAVRGKVVERRSAEPAHAPTAVAIAGPDRSRGARPSSTDWDCSHRFPRDADAGDRATVLIAVTVLPNGTPRAVSVLRDPGHGFGAAARACALAQRYVPALDRAGDAIAATTPPITVRFSR